MTILLRDAARTEIARSLYRDIYNENDFFYFFVSKTQSWGDELSPDTPVDSIYADNEWHRNMLLVRRIQASDVVLAIPRRNWVYGTVYDQYDDALSPTNLSYNGHSKLSNAHFYVLTDDDHVYKCLDNNKNSPSTIKPSGTSTSAFDPGDGYVWKFMFKVEAADKTKFLTPDYIPTRKIAGYGDPVFDVNGYLDDITLVDGGSGYSTAPTVVINGDGAGAVATATVVAGSVTEITVTNPGYGYTFAYITFSNPVGFAGVAAEATAVLGYTETGTLQETVENSAIPGTVDRIIVEEAGANYIEGDTVVNIIGDGSGAEAVALVNEITGAIDGIQITNQGSNYSFATATIETTLGSGSGAVLRPILSPPGGHGSNAQRELFAKNVLFSLNLINDSADMFLNNDYRQIGIIKNPYEYGTTNNFQEISGTCCYVIQPDDISQFAPDDEITTDDGGKFIVVQIVDANDDGINDSVYLLPIIPLITISSTLENITQDISAITINTVTEPEVNNRSGTVLYIENREFITRDPDQTEKVRAVLKF